MRTWSPKDIAGKEIETYPFESEWKKILGEPDVRFSTLIRGEAKSGKSTYSAKFAQYVSQWGRVLYISAEERINSVTLQLRIKSCEVTSQNVRFVHTRSLDEIDKLIQRGGYRFVIIDSVQHVQMNYVDFERLREKYKRRKLSWHLIMQMGESITKWKHEVDVLIEVKQGFAHVHGRYSKADRVQVFKPFNRQPGLFD